MASYIVRSIPNTLTCCNLLSGCGATLTAINSGDFKLALLYIIIGAVFDFFDGFAARMLHVSSPIGKELDSLADVITFGMAPAAIVWAYLNTCHFPLSIFPFLMVAFSALRLAKFNLDERQTSSFIGLPTPANALFWARPDGRPACRHLLGRARRHPHKLLAVGSRDPDVCPKIQEFQPARQYCPLCISHHVTRPHCMPRRARHSRCHRVVCHSFTLHTAPT